MGEKRATWTGCPPSPIHPPPSILDGLRVIRARSCMLRWTRSLLCADSLPDPESNGCYLRSSCPVLSCIRAGVGGMHA